MTTKAQLKKAIDDYFGDTSRPASETREGLLEMAEHMQMIATTLPESDDDG